MKKTGELSGPVCLQEMEVRWGDCDAAGIVYYPRYFDWFTDGRVALLKQIKLPYQTCFHEQGIVMVTLEAFCRYRKPLKPEDKCTLRTEISELGRTRMAFNYVVTRSEDGSVAAEGKTVHVYTDPAGKPFDVKKKHPLLWGNLSKSLQV